jgi:transcriptional regulator with XRE-family HTH domain
MLAVSQGELATAIGVSFQQVQKYERGVNRVSASTLVRIAKRLGVTAAALIGEDETVLGHSGLSHNLFEDGALDLLVHYTKMKPATRKALLGLTEALAMAKP